MLKLVLLLASLGALLKSIGAVYGSKAALIDALTCIANMAASVALVYALRVSSKPPDEDHHYGHARFQVAAILWTTIIYAIVAGYGLAELLLEPPSRRVSAEAVYYTAAGTAVYAIAIAIADRLGVAGRAYALFSATEIYEGLVTVASATAGSLWSPLYDLLGAWGLLAYLYYELYHHVHELTNILVERTPPELRERVKKVLEALGAEVVEVKLRPILPGEYTGELRIRLCGDAQRLKLIRDKLAELRVYASIYLEPC